MKRLILTLALIAPLAACASHGPTAKTTDTEFDRIISKPILDYCAKAATTRHMVKHPSTSLMGGMREYRQEMEAQLRSQEDLCGMQKAGVLPKAGSPWPSNIEWRK